jgi:hypothetical protein
MTEAGSTGRVPPVPHPAWTGDPEVPDADAEEQSRDVVDDPEEADPETTAGRDLSRRLADRPLEVSEADLVDQAVEVPFDDDIDRS